MRIALQKPRAAAESKETDSTAARLPAAAEDAKTKVKAASGTLSVVSVPIGNLDDITVRALRILRDADLIVAEDLRITRRLLQWHSVLAPDMVSLRPRRAQAALTAMQDALAGGRHVALVCDAGTPGIADAGQDFVGAALSCGAAVTAAPGPCAALAALAVSGLPASVFAFRGFPPRARAARAVFFRELARAAETTVFYEKPSLLAAALEELCRFCGDLRPAALACALTKPAEQVRRGTLAELRDSCAANPLRGEIVLVLGGLPQKNRD